MTDDQEDVADVEAEPEGDAPEAPEGQPGIDEDRSADLDGIEIDADDLEPEADDVAVQAECLGLRPVVRVGVQDCGPIFHD